MKKNIYIILSLAVALLMSCDLDKFPEGDIITDQQKEDVIAGSPEKLAADVNGLASGLMVYQLFSDVELHFDYGYASVCLHFDAAGQDMVSPSTGYNWFRKPMLFTDRLYTSEQTEFVWKTYYNHIKAANDILKVIPSDTEETLLKYYRGQALASRAFDYLNLIQAYQFTYKGHEDALGVPILLEEMPIETINNNPRASVSQVYELILSDLDQSIKLLQGYNRKDKGSIDQKVAYGLRARANLLMHNWEAAANDAEKAMVGFTPYSKTDVSVPSFNTSTASSWMWANVITEDNAVVKSGILNWPSHLCSFTGNGYTTATGTFRKINKLLWDQIPSSDVRKGWWIDEKLSSPLTDDIYLTDDKGNDIPASEGFGWEPYTNVKFHAYQSIPGNGTNASDWPIMRVEEMILIKAEAQAMAGNLSGAKATLEDFVKGYRDPEFKSKASSPEELRDEVWFQRRLELWGEGFSLFDILRLKKPIIRVENGQSNYPADARFNIEAEAPILLYLVPEAEISVNDGIGIGDNNESATPPSPVRADK